MKYVLIFLCLCACGCPSRFRTAQPDPEQVFLDKVKASLKELDEQTDVLLEEGIALNTEYKDLATQKIKILNTLSDEELDAFAAFEKVYYNSTITTELIKEARNVKKIVPAEKMTSLNTILTRQTEIAVRGKEINRQMQVASDKDKQIREVLKDSLAHSRQTELAEINAGDMFLPPIQHEVFIYHPYP